MKFASKDDLIDVPGTAALYRIRVPVKRDKITIAQRTREAGGRYFGDAAITARVGVVLERVIQSAAPEHRADYERQLETVRRFSEERTRIEAVVGDAMRAIVRRVRSGLPAGGSVQDAIAPQLEELRDFMPIAEDYAQIERLVDELDEGVRQMRAANETYMQWYNLTAAETLLAGWVPDPTWKGRDGKPLRAFARVAGRLAPGLIDAIPDEDVGRIGDAVFAAMSPTEAEVKNSESPLGTGPGGEPSTDSKNGVPTPPPPTTATTEVPTAAS